MHRGVKADLSDDSSLGLQKGKTSDIVATKVGFNSGLIRSYALWYLFELYV